MVYYKPVKVTINAPGLAEVILNVVVWHHGLPDLIVSDRGSLFTSKFWSLFCSLSALNGGSQLLFILKQTARPSGKIAPWKLTSEHLSTLNRITRPGFYQWRSSLTRMPGMLAPVTRLLNWTIATTLGCHIRKMLTPTPSPGRWISYQRNLES